MFQTSLVDKLPWEIKKHIFEYLPMRVNDGFIIYNAAFNLSDEVIRCKKLSGIASPYLLHRGNVQNVNLDEILKISKTLRRIRYKVSMREHHQLIDMLVGLRVLGLRSRKLYKILDYLRYVCVPSIKLNNLIREIGTMGSSKAGQAPLCIKKKLTKNH